MSVATSISKAKALYSKGQSYEAIFALYEVLNRFPANLPVKKELRRFAQLSKPTNKHPSERELNALVAECSGPNKAAAFEKTKQAAARYPNSSIVANMFGALCAEFGFTKEAKYLLEHSIKLDPVNHFALNNLGNVYRDLRKSDEAIFFYGIAVALKPDFSLARMNMGISLSDTRKFEDAIACFRKVIKSQPQSGSAYRNLSLILDFKHDLDLADKIASLLEESKLTDFDRSELLFASAKACEDLGQYREAFERFKAGGELKQKHIGYSRVQDAEIFEHSSRLLEMLDEVETPAFKKPAEAVPIFIVGMPRSGSSLVEQILSRHSSVQPAGELPFVEQLSKKYFRGDKQPNPSELLAFREAYLEKILEISSGKPFVTDKMPQNFLHIGLILKAIPESKIIHVTRDAKATCWSNFKHCFTSAQMAFSFDLEQTVAYYLRYVSFIELVKQRYKNSILDVDYDLLCQDHRTRIEVMLSAIELPIEEPCFTPHESQHIARTASRLQVQSAIYQGSSAKWKNYEAYTSSAFLPLDVAR